MYNMLTTIIEEHRKTMIFNIEILEQKKSETFHHFPKFRRLPQYIEYH